MVASQSRNSIDQKQDSQSLLLNLVRETQLWKLGRTKVTDRVLTHEKENLTLIMRNKIRDRTKI